MMTASGHMYVRAEVTRHEVTRAITRAGTAPAIFVFGALVFPRFVKWPMVSCFAALAASGLWLGRGLSAASGKALSRTKAVDTRLEV